MSLLSRLAGFFGSEIRSRGRDYQRGGAVQITRQTDTSVRASVQGTRSYRVDIKWEGGEVEYKCNCPYGVEFDAPCKHIWATLLEADERRLLPGRVAANGASNGDEPADDSESERSLEPIEDDGITEVESECSEVDEADDEVEADDESDSFHAQHGNRPLTSVLRDYARRRRRPPGAQDAGGGPFGRSTPPGKDEWKRQLARLRQDMEAQAPPATTPNWPEGRRLVYVVDPSSAEDEGGLGIELATESLKPDGTWDRPKPAKLSRDEIDYLPDPADRQIVQMLVGARGESSSFYVFGSGFEDVMLARRFSLPGPGAVTILRAMCATGRARLRRVLTTASDIPVPLQCDDGPPWEFWLDVGRSPGGRNYVLGGSIRRAGEATVPLADVELLLRDGLVFLGTGTVARLEHFGAFDLIEMLRDGMKLTVPGEHGDDLLHTLFSLPRLPKLDLPEELRVEEVSPTPRPHLKIRSPKRKATANERLTAEVTFDYAGQTFSAHESAVVRYDAPARRVVRRDPRAELTYVSRLFELGFKAPAAYSESSAPTLAPAKLPKVVRELAGEGWHVEAEGKLYRTPGQFKVSVKSGIDWFELHGEIDFGGGLSAPLPKLLAAVRKGERFVALGDGTFGLLPEEWLAKYGALASLGEEKEDHVEFSKRQVGFLDVLLASMPDASCDETFARARDALLKFQGVEAEEAPPGFIGVLRPYQRDGLGWMSFLRAFNFGGCLADDMGLGKTVQVLALLEARRESKPMPSLVVVPKSLVFNWKAEATRFAPALRVLDHTGAERERASGHFENYDLILTTYGTLRRDAEVFKDVQFDYVILDEAQAIKNASTGAAKAARLLRGDHRLALSGTPVQNHLGELWSLFEFLNPGMMGAASVLRATSGATSGVMPVGANGGLDTDARVMLSRALRPFILRRTKEQVATDLPQKLEQTLLCEMDDAQRKLYDELRDHYRQSLLERVTRDGINKSKMHVLEALLRLRQAACHPGLIDKSRVHEPSAKLDTLLEQIGQVVEEDHKVLVFSQFTSLLAIVRHQLDAQGIVYEYLDGKTRDREQRVNRFQTDPNCKLFLISLKAGGLGLNLTAAEYVYLLDPWWNPAVEAQAIDRAHRIGQTRRVFAYRLIAKDTVEEKVLALQQTKRDLADAIINADNSLIGKLGKEDLELLLS